MGRIFKWLGSPEQARELWENREALDKYLARLKELMEKDDSVTLDNGVGNKDNREQCDPGNPSDG